MAAVEGLKRKVLSVSAQNDNDKAVWFTKDWSGICERKDFKLEVTGDYLPVVRSGGVFELPDEDVERPVAALTQEEAKNVQKAMDSVPDEVGTEESEEPPFNLL